jgi:small-conductance mechanosensitive channel
LTPTVTVVTVESDTTEQESDTTVDVVCSNSGQLCETLYELTGSELFAEATSFVLGVPIKILLILTVALIVNHILRRVVQRLADRIGSVTRAHGHVVVEERNVERATERSATLGSMFRSVVTALVFGAAFIMILEAVGISVVAVIASAGVLSLAFGFGAQSVVEDLLRGIFMLAEDQFGVGDRIDVGVVDGYVERITLRTVVIRAPDGTLWHVPNSEINLVANESQLRSRAEVEIGVAYSVDIGRAIEVLDDATSAVLADPEWAQVVEGDGEVQGVQKLGDDAVIIRVVVWVESESRRRFERHLRRVLKDALDANGIEIPYRQLDVRLRESSAALAPAGADGRDHHRRAPASESIDNEGASG